MAERICLVTGKACMGYCNPDDPCFIDVKARALVRKMAQIASDEGIRSVENAPQLSNVTIEYKLKIADEIKDEAKRILGYPYQK